jgi:Zn-dependent protease with chaperone function
MAEPEHGAASFADPNTQVSRGEEPMVSTDMQPMLSAQSSRAMTNHEPFPALDFAGGAVQPDKHIAPGTGLRTLLAWIPMLAILGFLAISTMGIGLLAAVISGWLMRKKIHARIKGSGLRVGPDQLPEIHKVVESFARRLGMKKVPEVYVVEDAVQNGVAVKLGSNDIVLLTDDVIWGALHAGDPRALGYVIGHELAHVALGHTGTLRSIQRNTFPSLGRLDEFTADNVATALVNDRSLAVKGITLLTVGPQLVPHINMAAMERQAKEVWSDKQSKKAEQGLTHPLLFRRIANVLGAQW